MRFAEPKMFWLLLVAIPALALFYAWAWRKRQKLISQFVQSRLLANLTSGVSLARQKIRIGLILSSVALIFMSLARPQWGFTWEEAHQRGLDIIVAIDTSRSMLATDIAPNRLERAKLAALDLMKQAKSDRLGLVAFAGAAFLQCPLTLDDEAFRESLHALDTDVIPQGGTAIAEAINTSVEAFGKEGDNHKILILFTDGEDHEEGAVEAAKKANEAGLRIFTVGIGTPKGELLRMLDKDGKSSFIKDDNGNAVMSRLNEDLLREIATTAGGFYLPLSGSKTIDMLYERGLAPLPKGDVSSKLIKKYSEHFQWPLGLAIVLLILELFLPELQRKSAKETSATAVAPAFERKAFLTLLCLIASFSTLHASPSTAKRDYEAGKYNAAEKEYEKLLEKKPDDPRLHYNAGAAAFRARDFDKAAKNFEAAMLSPDLNLQQNAYYNHGNTLYRLGENNSETEAKSGFWKKSIEDYDRALKLNPQDKDSLHNKEFVTKKLEELQKQQDQQKKNDQKNQDQGKNKDDSKDQSGQKNQNQQNNSQNSDKQQNKEQKQAEQKQQNSGDQNTKPDRQKQEQDKDKSQDQKQQTASKQAGKDDGKSGKPSTDKSDSGAAQAVQVGVLTKEQAMQLLDSVKGSERTMVFQPILKPNKATNQNRIFKNW